MNAEVVWLPLRAFTDPYWVPWVPTRRELLDTIFSLVKPTARDVFYDLGSGDGRVVVEAARRGAGKAVGIERNPELVAEAWRLAHREGVADRVKFILGDFFSIPIRDATIVYMYLLTRINRMLRRKLEAELRLGTRIITLDFEIPGWRPVHVVSRSVSGMERTIYLYVKGVSNP